MIKNYTSAVPASRSISYIEHQLVIHGATDIVKRYGPNKELTEICFAIDTKGARIPFMLPARVDRVEKVLMAQVRRPKPGTKQRVKEQAEKTAWKIISDWVAVQMSLIELGQVEFLEVFLPYVYDMNKQETFFEKMKGNGFLQLTQHGGRGHE